MMAVAFRITGSKHQSEDVVQDVLKDLWEKHENIKITESPHLYAMKCVRNRCIDLQRRTSATINVDDVEMELYNDIDDNDDYINKINSVYNAISGLKEPYKTVIKLNLEGKSTNEISEAMKLSINNIRMILSRTRRKLRLIINSQITKS